MTSHQPVRLIDSQQNFNGHISSPLSSIHSETLNNIENTKSFIRERIERLYGPGALAAGFTRRSPSQSGDSMGNNVKRTSRPEGRIIPIQLEYEDQVDQATAQPAAGMPSVFRHLRPEFRHQLPVKSPLSPSHSVPTKKSESPGETNGHVVEIPISVESTNGVTKQSSSSANHDTALSSDSSPLPSNTNSSNVDSVSDNVVVSPLAKSTVDNSQTLDTIQSEKSKEVESTSSSHNGCGASTQRNQVAPESENSQPGPSQETASGKTLVKDGHYFLKVRILRDVQMPSVFRKRIKRIVYLVLLNFA